MDHEKIEQESSRFIFTVQPLQVDFQGKFSLIHLCELILDSAARDASNNGFGLQHVKTSNLAWVLTRLSIRVEKYAGLFDTLSIETWVDSVNTSFSLRKFNIYNKEGRIIASSSTTWMLIDIATRRPQPLKEETFSSMIVNDKYALTGIPEKIDKAAHHSDPFVFYVRYSDLDIQDHVNSGKYIQWLMDMFPKDLYLKKSIEEIQVNYLSECVFGDKISVYATEIDNGNYILEVIKESGKPACRAYIKWI